LHPNFSYKWLQKKNLGNALRKLHRILHSFEGESVKELTEAFHEAVDDYLAYCEDEGIEPDKSYTGVLNVRLTPSIHRQIAMLARQAGLTINAYIKDTLENKIKTAAVL